MDAAKLDQIVERLFAAFVAHDLDLVESMMTPEATMSQNGAGGSFAIARSTSTSTSQRSRHPADGPSRTAAHESDAKGRAV